MFINTLYSDYYFMDALCCQCLFKNKVENTAFYTAFAYEMLTPDSFLPLPDHDQQLSLLRLKAILVP